LNDDYPGEVILAVDTSLGTAVALIDDDGTRLSDASAADPLGHAEVIGELLVRALDGPGPFTGLRIGIATSRTFAMGRGIPVVDVPSHFAAALTAIEHDAVTGPFAIVTDARRREVAITVFDGTDADGIPHVTADTVLVARVDADDHLDGIRRIDAETLSAVDLARVGARAVAAGRTLTGAEPLYLRQPDVRVPGAPKKVGS
jgi:tRNA threonylcarbamoyladenosine biosynthesis protein TsaB